MYALRFSSIKKSDVVRYVITYKTGTVVGKTISINETCCRVKVYCVIAIILVVLLLLLEIDAGLIACDGIVFFFDVKPIAK